MKQLETSTITPSFRYPPLLEPNPSKNAPGSRPGAPWGALGGKNASRLKNTQKLSFSPSLLGPFLGYERYFTDFWLIEGVVV